MSALLAIILFADVSVAGPPGLAEAKKIHIESSWGGMGRQAPVAVTITKQKDGSYSDGKRSVDAKAVRVLAARLRQPWRLTFEDAQFPLKPADVGVKTTAELRKRLESYFLFTRWTDDYPRVTVELTWGDGTITVAKSDAQHDYMIPWDVGGNAQWAPDLGIAVAALLPPKSTNRDRLAGTYLADELKRGR